MGRLIKIITITFVIGSAILAGVTTFNQSQPAYFWIDLFAPHAGDTYSIKLVFLLTWLMLLLPLILLLVGMRFFRAAGDSNANMGLPGTTGIWVTRKKQLQSALMGIPIYINETRSGSIDSGKRKFFECGPGSLTLRAGDGKPASEKIIFELKAGEQNNFELEILQAGLGVSYFIRKV